MAKKRGISLNIDEEGSVTAVAPEIGEICGGLCRCSKCIEGMCHAIYPSQNVLLIKACPFKKWHVLWYASRYKENVKIIDGNCECCYSNKRWRLKKNGSWICGGCHEPVPGLKIEWENGNE